MKSGTKWQVKKRYKNHKKRTKQKFWSWIKWLNKNAIESINNSLYQSEELNYELKDRSFEMIQSEEQKSKTNFFKKLKRLTWIMKNHQVKQENMQTNETE